MIKTWMAFLLTVAVILFGFIFATYNPYAPFEVMAYALVGALGIYAGKRTWQKHKSFNGGNNGRITGQNSQVDGSGVHSNVPRDYVPDDEELQAITTDRRTKGRDST